MKKVLLSCMMLLGIGASAFADEIVSYEPGETLTSVSVGDIFAIYNANEQKFLFGSGAQNLGYDEAQKAFVSTNSGWLFKLAEGDTDGHYTLILQKPDGSGDYNIWGNLGYLNSQPASGGCSFILGLKHNDVMVWGQDGENLALWEVEAVTDGFKLKNVGTGLYLNSNAPAKFSEEEAVVWTFCTLKESSVENPIEKPERTATDAKVISFDDFGANDWDAEAKTFTGDGKFNWGEDGLDLSQYQYLIATTAKNLCKGGYEVSIKDKNGKTVQGNQYGADFMNMWFGEWNNHNCMKIDLEKLRVEQQFDIYHITELTINGGDGFILGNVYATNQKPTNDKSWNGEDEGDFSVSGVEVDKFGTICLPFPAAVAGAYVYEIASANEYGVSLAQYDGLLEAGKAYIYKTNASNDGGKAPAAVRFYKATATTAESPVANNGLVGTFEATTAPEGSLVLSNNSLYTVDSDVTIGANKAWIDPTAVTSTSRGTVFLSFGEVTGIKAANVVETLNDSKVFDLQGREVAQPKKGVYLVSGKKVVIK